MLSGARGGVPTAAAKSIRLTLFDQSNSLVMQAVARGKGGGNHYGRCLYAQKKADAEQDAVFVGLIEPVRR